jgi:GNAT superfamily N-acetyltransferase
LHNRGVGEIVFRRAGLVDVPADYAHDETAYRGEQSKAGWTTEADLLDGRRTDADAVADIVGGARSRVIVAVDADPRGGDIVACCQLEQRADTMAYFGLFAVRPELQGGGIGGRLLAEAERQARDDWSAHAIEMTVIAQREELIAWYARRGYAPTGETRPFPYGDERFGLPRRDDLAFAVLVKRLD